MVLMYKKYIYSILVFYKISCSYYVFSLDRENIDTFLVL